MVTVNATDATGQSQSGVLYGVKTCCLGFFRRSVKGRRAILLAVPVRVTNDRAVVCHAEGWGDTGGRLLICARDHDEYNLFAIRLTEVAQVSGNDVEVAAERLWV